MMNPRLRRLQPTRSSTSVAVAASISLLFLALCPIQTQGLVTLSRYITQLAFHGSIDPTLYQILAIGVLFRGTYDDLTLQGQSDIDCYIAIGDLTGFERTVLETPQMCIGFQFFDRGTATDGSTTTSLPRGVISGIHNNQAIIASADFSDHILTMANPIDLPQQYFPVSLSTDAQGGVYVALHSTAGILPSSNSDNNDQSETLYNIYNYFQQMTHPNASVHDAAPQVVKIDILTGDLLWELALETELGRSTVAAVALMTSRDWLVVAGSSNGSGSYVGAGVHTTTWDGYVTLVNATSGKVDDSKWAASPLAADHSLRVTSQVGKHDYVLGMCIFEDDIYLVGTTEGTMVPGVVAGGGFVTKLDADTLQISWTRQWEGIGVQALTCEATEDFVYVSGHVPESVLLNDTTRTQSSDNQDIFVSLLDASSGEMRWTRQVDSRRPDFMASISYHVLGYSVLTANSMDLVNGVSVLYALTFEHETGYYDWQGMDPQDDPLGAAFGDLDTPTSPTQFPTTMSTPSETANTPGIVSDNDKDKSTIIAVAIVIPVLLLLAVLVYTAFTRRSSIEVQSNPALPNTNDTATDLQPSPATTTKVV